MRKRNLFLLIAMISVFLIAAGCSSNADSNQTADAPDQNQSTEPVATQYSTTSDAVTTNDSIDASTKVFTVDELKAYNGQDGNPAYIAIDGVVYDVTNEKMWRNGKHKGYSAGNDLTEEIGRSPHGKSILGNLTEIGTLE